MTARYSCCAGQRRPSPALRARPRLGAALYRNPFGGTTQAACEAVEGWVIEESPFIGTGFVPNIDQVIREFKVDGIALPHRSEIVELDISGVESRRAVWDGDRHPAALGRAELAGTAPPLALQQHMDAVADAVHSRLVEEVPGLARMSLRWLVQHGSFSTWDQAAADVFHEVRLPVVGGHHRLEAVRLLAQPEVDEMVLALNLRPVDEVVAQLGELGRARRQFA